MKNGIVTALVLSISWLGMPSPAHDKDSGPSSSRNAKQVVEYKIAGLRPGRDAIDKAYHRFGKSNMFEALSRPGSAVWVDDCNHQMLTVAFDTDSMIRDVTIEHSPGVIDADCEVKSYSRTVRARMGGTGHGLVFRDRCDRVQEIYGSLQSEGHSTDGEEELVYRFEGGVKGTALTFEVTCGSALREVQTIKLTASVSRMAGYNLRGNVRTRKP